MGEKEDDPNPYTRIRRKAANDLILKRCNEAWQEGRQYEKDYPSSKAMMTIEGRAQSVGFREGQLHPSPQTIKKIQGEVLEDFVFSLKEAIKHKWLGWEYIQSDLGKVKVGKGEITLHEIYEAIDTTLKEKEED